MPRPPKPWLRKGRGWYVTIRGKQHYLGQDKQQAQQRFHELMAAPKPPPPSTSPLLATLFDDFLEWVQTNRAKGTFEAYQHKLQSFLDHAPEHLSVQDLKPYHVQQWLDANPSWSTTTGHTRVSAVQRALNWAVKMGLTTASPIIHFEKPTKESRDGIVSLAEFNAILGATQDQAFHDLLTLHWETGCRPQESLRVEARFVDLKFARWIFPVKKSKGKRKPRIVYLNDKSLAITKRQMQRFPEGPILRNVAGSPWTKDAVNCRFHRLKQKLNRKYCLYLLRHSFATRMLEAGLDALTVALLLGHSNAAMLSTTYQHLAHNPIHMLDQLKRATE